MSLVGWLVSDGAALVAGLGAGWRWASGRRAAEKAADEQRWRVNFAALNAFLLTLGYEPAESDGEYIIEAPGNRIVLRVPIAHLDPAALQADLGDLPHAREWVARRRPSKPARAT